MSTYGYTGPYCGAPLMLSLHCDGCGAVLRTRRTVDEVPFHRTMDARFGGWARRKGADGKLKDYCPKCASYLRRMHTLKTG